MERRFQPVYISEPSVEDTIAILRGLKERYEIFHGVRITEDALHAAVILSNRYISDRFLPDKAIDLIDEAASLIRMQLGSRPLPIDVKEREMASLIVKQEALKREDTQLARSELQLLEKKIADLKEELSLLRQRWENEKKLLEFCEREKRRTWKNCAFRKKRQTRALITTKWQRLRYSRIPALQKEIEEADQTLNLKENRYTARRGG